MSNSFKLSVKSNVDVLNELIKNFKSLLENLSITVKDEREDFAISIEASLPAKFVDVTVHLLQELRGEDKAEG